MWTGCPFSCEGTAIKYSHKTQSICWVGVGRQEDGHKNRNTHNGSWIVEKAMKWGGNKRHAGHLFTLGFLPKVSPSSSSSSFNLWLWSWVNKKWQWPNSGHLPCSVLMAMFWWASRRFLIVYSAHWIIPWPVLTGTADGFMYLRWQVRESRGGWRPVEKECSDGLQNCIGSNDM